MTSLVIGAGPIFDPAALRWPVVFWPLLFGLGMYLILTSSSQPIGRPKPDLRQRLRRLDVDERVREALARRDSRGPMFVSPVMERLLRPVVDDLGGLLQTALTRVGLAGADDLARKLVVAWPGVEPRQFWGEKALAGAIGLGLFPLLNLLGRHPLGPWPAWLWLLAGVVGCLAPDWRLARRLAARRTEALMELPAILDLLAISVSAGLALEQALERVAAQSRGVVAQELQQATREMRLGGTLPQALEALTRRNSVAELGTVVAQLRVAHEHGLPLAPALAAQAAALRERKRLRILEAGGEASVRMLLPVAVLILPVLFVILLVPAGAELLRLGG